MDSIFDLYLFCSMLVTPFHFQTLDPKLLCNCFTAYVSLMIGGLHIRVLHIN